MGRKFSTHGKEGGRARRNLFYFKDLRADRRIIIRWSLSKSDIRLWTVFVWLQVGTSRWLCEHECGPSGL
jgi:hypothetical protein